MSPASQGNLEVKRYIGTNLISSCARVNGAKGNKKGRKPEGKPLVQRPDAVQNPEQQHHGGNRQHFAIPNILPACGCNSSFNFSTRAGQFRAAGWTGVPLISVAEDSKKKNHSYQDRSFAVDDDSSLRTPLSRLAIHTQGAPLILTGRCYNSRKNQNKGNNVRNPRGDLVIRRSNKYKDNHTHGGTSDCLSVASDESSGSGHSENCLPRIIKPRKRRKKDRKPSIPSAESFGGEKTNGESSNACDTKSDTDVVAGGKTIQKCDIKPNLATVGLSNGSRCEDTLEDEACGPKLHHTFEDVTESESLSYGCLPSSCQCHYCDPSGIWDAPSNFFPSRRRNPSPYLSPPPDSSKSFHYFTHSDLALRRSWSEPMPNPLGDIESKTSLLPLRSNSFTDVKTSKTNTWKNESADTGKTNGDLKSTEKMTYGSQCLEVSTEIVTSPNGHRDIEIRFYSTSPPSS